ncbi:MAG: BNR-4 repeat-containing protein [Paludibacteraceae bacterium]
MNKIISLLIMSCFSILGISAQSNLLSGWDGNGDTNTSTSYPNKYGWAISTGSFNYANSTSGVRWMDINDGKHANDASTVHTYNGANYTGRLQLMRWDGAGSTSLTSVYSFPVTLGANKRYKFSWVYEWWNNATVPTLTVGISRDKLATDNLTTTDFVCSTTKNILSDGNFEFFNQTAGTYYLTVKGNNLKVLCAAGNLSLTETALALDCNVNSIRINDLNPDTLVTVHPNGSTDPITITAPAGITLSASTLPSTGGSFSVSDPSKANVTGNIIISQGSNQITIPVIADFSAESASSIVTNEGAWCWFADPRALYYENPEGTIKRTYMAYIDVHGAIKASQIDHLTNERSEVLIRSHFQPDDHDNPTFLVLPDKRIMIFYSQHSSEKCFYYRVTEKPGDITTLGKEIKITTTDNTTYPNPFILSDDPTHIYLCWRGINWHPTIARMPIPAAENGDVVDFDWGPYQIVQSTGARPYAKYASNGKDKIYLTYTTAHPDVQNPNYIYYNIININTKQLSDIKGNELSVIGNSVHNVAATSDYKDAHPYAVVDDAATRDWIWQLKMDNNFIPNIAMVRISDDKTSHDYYYAKWTGTEWRKTFIKNGGGQFHQSPGTEMCYSGGMAIDDADTHILYCSVPVNGKYGTVYEIKRFVIGDDGTVQSEIQITENSSKNNVRPYSITNSGNKNMLAWLKGDYYYWAVTSSFPKGYSTAVHANFTIPESVINLNNGLIVDEKFNNNNGFTGSATASNGLLAFENSLQTAVIQTGSNQRFSISVSPYINNNNYDGKIFQMGSLSYGINSSNDAKPYIKIGEKRYDSSNALGNSDGWSTSSSLTKYDFFCLTLTYENGTLKTYINGLIDQNIAVEGLTLENIILGGYKGVMDYCKVYNRVLNQDEIKNISKALKDSVANLKNEANLQLLSVPKDIHTDIVLQSTLISGETVAWTTSNSDLITNAGIVTLPQQPTAVTLTASVTGVGSKTFNVTVYPRSIENNKVLNYQFDATDVYTENNTKYVRDKSVNGNDAIIYGNAQINGKLDLTSNTAADFDTNGYAKAPDNILNDLRSYSFIATVNPTRLDGLPRIYDFGSASSNSVFGRLNGLSAGLKYNGTATKLINSTYSIPTGKETALAFTFDAKSQTTKIYVDGEENTSATTIINESYQVGQAGLNNRNYIGRTQWWDTSTANSNIDYCGTIDDFFLFNIALTKEELNQLLTTGLNTPQTMSGQLNIFPNPVSNQQNIYINCDLNINKKKGLEVKIIDGIGKIVQCFRTFDTLVYIKNTFEKGLYIVSVGNETKVSIGKFIVL